MHLYLEAIEARFQAFEHRLNELTYRSSGQPSPSFQPNAPGDHAPNPTGGRGQNTGGANLGNSDYRPSLGNSFSGQAATDASGEPIVIRADITDPGVRRSHAGKAEVIVGKQRHGPIGTVELSFEGRFTRFGNLVQARQSGGYD